MCEWGKSSWICPYQVLTWQATHEWSRKWLSWKPIVKLSRWRLPVCFFDLCALGLVYQCLNGNQYCNFVFHHLILMAYASSVVIINMTNAQGTAISMIYLSWLGLLCSWFFWFFCPMLALVLPKPISSDSASGLVVLDAVLEKEEEKNRFRAKVLQQGMSNGQNTVEKTLLVVLRDCN